MIERTARVVAQPRVVSATEPGEPVEVDVSVIVPVYNDASRLRLCLAALEAQSFSGRYEVIVVDNGSSDDPTAVVAEHLGARVVREQRPGSYAARNRGLDEARGGLIAFTDADCIPDSEWLERGVAAARSHELGFVVGRVELFPRDPRRPTAVELWELNHGFQQELRVRRMSYGATANLLVPRSVLAAVGPFDPGLRSSGDKEWGVRATAAGCPPIYVRDLVVRHPARATWKELRAKYARIAAGKLDLRRAGSPAAQTRRRTLAARGASLRRRWAEARHLGFTDRIRFLAVMLLVIALREYDEMRLTIRPRVIR